MEGDPIVKFLVTSVAIGIAINGNSSAGDSNLGLDLAQFGTKQPLKIVIVVPNFLDSPFFNRLLTFSCFFLDGDSGFLSDNLRWSSHSCSRIRRSYVHSTGARDSLRNRIRVSTHLLL